MEGKKYIHKKNIFVDRTFNQTTNSQLSGLGTGVTHTSKAIHIGVLRSTASFVSSRLSSLSLFAATRQPHRTHYVYLLLRKNKNCLRLPLYLYINLPFHLIVSLNSHSLILITRVLFSRIFLPRQSRITISHQCCRQKMAINDVFEILTRLAEFRVFYFYVVILNYTRSITSINVNL